MKLLAVILIISSSVVGAFWNGNNANWPPFGAGTGYNNQAPWGDNSNWSPFFATDGRWNPKNDAANLSRYGARPHVLTQYKNDINGSMMMTIAAFRFRLLISLCQLIW